MQKQGSKKPMSGGAKLKAAGKVPVLLGLTAEQAALLRGAAEADGRPLTQFLLHHGVVAAKKILKKSAESA